MRVVLDTNVIVSGIFFGGAPGAVLELINDNIITPCFTPSTWQELEEALGYEKFFEQWEQSPFSIDEFLNALKSNSLVFPEPSGQPNVVAADPDDDKFLACALAADAAFIVSGDKHLLSLKEFQGIPILAPSQFIALMKKH